MASARGTFTTVKLFGEKERKREAEKNALGWKSEKKTRDITRRGTRMPDRAESRRYLF